MLKIKGNCTSVLWKNWTFSKSFSLVPIEVPWQSLLFSSDLLMFRDSGEFIRSDVGFKPSLWQYWPTSIDQEVETAGEQVWSSIWTVHFNAYRSVSIATSTYKSSLCHSHMVFHRVLFLATFFSLYLLFFFRSDLLIFLIIVTLMMFTFKLHCGSKALLYKMFWIASNLGRQIIFSSWMRINQRSLFVPLPVWSHRSHGKFDLLVC